MVEGFGFCTAGPASGRAAASSIHGKVVACSTLQGTHCSQPHMRVTVSTPGLLSCARVPRTCAPSRLEAPGRQRQHCSQGLRGCVHGALAEVAVVRQHLRTQHSPLLQQFASHLCRITAHCRALKGAYSAQCLAALLRPLRLTVWHCCKRSLSARRRVLVLDGKAT